MGCGASKGAEAVAPSTLPNPPALKTEFTPDNKPSPAGQQDEAARTKGPAKRVDEILKSEADEFEDESDRRPGQQDGVTLVTAVVPPPSTPPAAAQKPLFQTSTGFDGPRGGGVAKADSGDVDFFPQQVTLKIGGRVSGGGSSGGGAGGGGSGGGGAGGYGQTQPTPVQTANSLQAFDSAGAGGFQPIPAVPSTRQLSQQQQQQQPFGPQGGGLQPLRQAPPQSQPQLASLTQPLQSQPQPLSESGPGAGSTGRDGSAAASGSGRAGGSGGGGGAPSADDPWSHLQTQYRIRESQAAPKAESGVLGSFGGARGGGGSGRGAGLMDTNKEVLVLGDDDEFSGGRPLMNGTMNRTARAAAAAAAAAQLPPRPPGGQPKHGGWGNGELARAGELMIGSEDDWLEADKPPGVGGGGTSSLAAQLPPPPGARKPVPTSAPRQQPVVSYSSGKQRADFDDRDHHAKPTLLKGPMAKGKAEDVMCEDIEDVDMLLEDEMERHGLSNKALASKLAAYEAQFKDG